MNRAIAGDGGARRRNDWIVNFIDIAVLVVIGFSALIAVSRGSSRSCCRSWDGSAVVATILLFPFTGRSCGPISRSRCWRISPPASGFSSSPSFCAAFLNQMISSRMRRLHGAIDRTLGLVFGLARGGHRLRGLYPLAWGSRIAPNGRRW